MSDTEGIAAQIFGLHGSVSIIFAALPAPLDLHSITWRGRRVRVFAVRRSFKGSLCLHVWVVSFPGLMSSDAGDFKYRAVGSDGPFPIKILPWSWGPNSKAALTLAVDAVEAPKNADWSALTRYLSVVSAQEDTAVAKWRQGKLWAVAFEGGYAGPTRGGVAFVLGSTGYVRHRFQLLDLPQFDIAVVTMRSDWSKAFAEIDGVLVELDAPRGPARIAADTLERIGLTTSKMLETIDA